MKLLVATGNRNKVKEISALLAGEPIEVLSLKDFPKVPEVIEDAPDFRGNALKKALTLFEHTGLPTLADDSGLCVDALGGAPGVFSARYAGEGHDDAANNEKLLKELEPYAEPTQRTARFVCEMALIFDADPDRRWFTRGEVEGRIAHELSGDSGFGYDPLFYVPSFGITLAQMGMARKNLISHRGCAARNMAQALAALRAAERLS